MIQDYLDKKLLSFGLLNDSGIVFLTQKINILQTHGNFTFYYFSLLRTQTFPTIAQDLEYILWLCFSVLRLNRWPYFTGEK